MNNYSLSPSLVVHHSRDNLHSLLALGVSKWPFATSTFKSRTSLAVAMTGLSLSEKK